MAQIYLNDDDHNDINSNNKTDKFLRTRIMMNDANKHYGVRISYGESIAAFIHLIGRGVYNFLPDLSKETTTVRHKLSQSQLIEDDYIFIFYLLLGINILAMVPAWYRHLFQNNNNKQIETHCAAEGNATTAQQHQHQQQHGIKIEEGRNHSHARTKHRKLLQTYLPAYLFATCADWLQGPYKYALYSSYGYTQRDIAHLFVAGYGSGMVLGSIVGGLADSYGRKRLCLFYCLSYTFSVLMKHCKHFYVLLLGRVGGGIATSLLFSVFESWLICAHGERGLLGVSSKKRSANGGGTDSDADSDNGGGDVGGKKNNDEDEEKWLAKSLSVSMYGSSLVAIGSGVLANLVVENSGKMRPWNTIDDGNDASEPSSSSFYVGGYITAFDACLVPLALCATVIAISWEENYGAEAEAASSSVAHVVESENKEEEEGAHYSNGQNNDGQYTAGFLKKHSSINLEDDGSTQDEKKLTIENNDEECKTLLQIEEDIYPRKEGMCSILLRGMHTVWNSPNILICCIIGSIFEGAMYIFVFLWTPALTSLQDGLNHSQGREVGNSDTNAGVIVDSAKDPHADSELPFGWIFSTFMVCCMLGTIAFSRLSDAGVSASKCLAGILALASLSCVAMAFPYYSSGVGNVVGLGGVVRTSANTPQYIGMLLYEFCIGFYYPAMGTVKGTIVPEHQRAAIYNVFRLPLNLLVLVYLVGDFSTEVSFLANAILLLAACVLQIRIVRGIGGDSGSGSGGGSEIGVVESKAKGHDL